MVYFYTIFTILSVDFTYETLYYQTVNSRKSFIQNLKQPKNSTQQILTKRKKTKHKNIKTYTLTMNKMQRHIYHIRNTRKSIAKKYIYSRLITFGNDDFIERTIYIYIHNTQRKT